MKDLKNLKMFSKISVRIFLEKRLGQHNNSKWGAHYTKLRRPVTLKYSEEFKILKDARRRESEIKGWRKEKKIALIVGKI